MAQKPFKDREQVRNEIRIWGLRTDFCIIFAILLALVGVIGEALKIDLRLATTTWLLMGVLFLVGSLGPHLELVALKHLYGIEAENKNK